MSCVQKAIRIIQDVDGSVPTEVTVRRAEPLQQVPVFPPSGETDGGDPRDHGTGLTRDGVELESRIKDPTGTGDDPEDLPFRREATSGRGARANPLVHFGTGQHPEFRGNRRPAPAGHPPTYLTGS